MGKRKIGNLWEVIDLKQKETFLCIDLKSFYASVECVERGLDPFTTNLVVADPDRSVSTICLAITPAMKKLGIRNRCRIHEIPDHIEYIVAKPRMQLYMEYSARIYGIYLNYVAKEDIHVYSVDECFMDVTRYLLFYGTTIIPFKDKFDKSLKLYSLMTTKPEEVEQREKEGGGNLGRERTERKRESCK